jgi:AcrR family transcriptional regulator
MARGGTGPAGGGQRSKTRQPGRIAPIYKRLPHGPHQLPPEEVARHQRARIHGAMIEAVARSGYQGTSVKQVIGLAGVSRRSFYEIFANRQDCFLATFDLLAGRELAALRSAYLDAHGGLEDRLQAVFAHCAQTISGDRNAVNLVLLDIATAGPDGMVRFCRGAGECEQLLGACFELSSRAEALPAPILRGVVGGLHWSLAGMLAKKQLPDKRAMTEQMLEWTLRFRTPPGSGITEELNRRLRDRARQIGARAMHGETGQLPAEDTRTRLLHSVLQLCGPRDAAELSAPLIAERAQVSLDDFFALFPTAQDCLHAALEMTDKRLLEVAREAAAGQPDWTTRTIGVTRALLEHLAANPLHARTLVVDVNCCGRKPMQRHAQASAKLADLLAEGAPQDGCTLAAEGVVGAFWHTVRCQVTGGRVALLGALTDQMCHLALAPYLGAERAAEAVLASGA